MKSGLITKLHRDANTLNAKSLALACSIMAVTMMVMCLINIITCESAMAVLTGGMGIWFLLSLLLFYRTKSTRQLVLCILIAAYGMMMWFVVSGGVQGFSIVWLLVAPPAAMYCFSLFYGALFSLVLGVSMTVYMVMPPVPFGYDYTAVYRARFPIVYFFITLMCIFIQYHLVSSREKRTMLIEKLEAANRTKGDFLANMSHEIRTPMNAILGMCELVLREDISDEVRENCSNIRNSGESLLSIINDILDFSKIESGKTEIIKDRFNIGSLVNDVINMAVTRKGNKNIEIIARIDPTIPKTLIGDEMRIKQVMINLVTNAVKFTNEGAVVIKVTQTKQEYGINLRVSVMDTGIGITEENIEKLFTNFQQVDTRKNRAVEGTGLGLAISKRLIEKMGGFINVYSIYGEGSEFRFCLPLRVDESEPFVGVKKNENTRVAIYINAHKFKHPMIMLQYSRLIVELSETFGIPFTFFRSTQQLAAGIETGGFDYCFVAKEEFAEDSALYEQIAEKTHLSVIQDRFNAIKLPEKVSCVYKPFYVMSFAAVLNDEHFAVSSYREKRADIKLNGAQSRVLIVDDNVINLKVAEGLMRPYNLRIDTATSGQQAIDMLADKCYDLVFMDHMMPEMDGVETTTMIRMMDDEYYHTLPIIALTANAVNGAREGFMQSGFNDFLAKPIELSQLERVFKAWLPVSDTVQEADETAENAAAPEIELSQYSPQISFEKGIEYSGGNPVIYREILELYADNSAASIELLSRSVRCADMLAYATEAHAVKSTSMSVGASELAQLARVLEAAAKDADIEAVRASHDELVKLYRVVAAQAREYLRKG